jgi:hypothetical protein
LYPSLFEFELPEPYELIEPPYELPEPYDDEPDPLLELSIGLLVEELSMDPEVELESEGMGLETAEPPMLETEVATGTEVSVTGVPLGAETAGSLMELSGRGRAATKERTAATPMNEEIWTIIEF